MQPATVSAVDTGSCGTLAHPWWTDWAQSDGTWLESPWGRRDLCLTAYWDRTAYLEYCTPNNDYEKWYEEWQGNGWRLRNKATNLYLDSNSKGDVYALPWNGGNYQLWH
ncbi:hypothetical protein ACFQ9X_25470 [Catenulispora yoronensis]